MTDEICEPGNLPAAALYAVPVITADLKPEDMAEVLKRMFDLVIDSKSDPARVSAAKLLLDRLSPKENIEEKRREAEERHAAVAEAKCLLAEFTLAKSAGLYEPPALDQERPPEPDHAPGDGT